MGRITLEMFITAIQASYKRPYDSQFKIPIFVNVTPGAITKALRSYMINSDITKKTCYNRYPVRRLKEIHPP